jgi:dTMP kinase
MSKFYVFEGPDHSGKSTQVMLLQKFLENNKNFVFTREPGGNGLPVCEKIREIIIDANLKIRDKTEAFLYATGRSEHCEQITEWLESGKSVICDRFIQSSYVYQGIARGLGQDVVSQINKLAVGDLEPDLIFYFKLDIDTYAERKSGIKELDRLEQNSLEFFKKVIEGYDSTLLNRSNVVVIDATLPIDIIHKQILKYIEI